MCIKQEKESGDQTQKGQQKDKRAGKKSTTCARQNTLSAISLWPNQMPNERREI